MAPDHQLDPLDTSPLPGGVHSRFVDDVNGLGMHVLEAGRRGDPLLLLLHGFPELAYSWRKVIGPLAEQGYYVVAPDQRGYGRTSGWDDRYDGNLYSFRKLNLVRDALALVSALGYERVEAVIGHDFGSTVAAWCAVVRPDVFSAAVMMSAVYAGAPRFPFDTVAGAPDGSPPLVDIHADLAKLPRPRKHYQWYYSTPQANDDMLHPPQGLKQFLRAYYHYKSADWQANQPFHLKAWEASELAQMPTYYVMDLDRTMPETVAAEAPTAAEIATCTWLTEAELDVYAGEFGRTGFQGGLQWYRCGTSGLDASELVLFSGKTIDVPSCFIAGASDWGPFMRPGSLDAMQTMGCTDFRGVHFVEGAGHWVQQEQPEKVLVLLQELLKSAAQQARMSHH